MIARRSPARTVSSTPSSARRPPKDFEIRSRRRARASLRARPSRPSSRPRAAEGPDEAARREEDGADIDRPQDEEPALRVHAHEVLEEDDDGRAEGGADERA